MKLVTWLFVGSLVAAIVPFSAQAGSVNIDKTCPVVIDSNTDDWDALPNFYHDDEADVTGTQYYWSGDEWVTEEPDSYTYSTNVAAMADFENLKLCNDADHLNIYIDTFQPIFGLNNVLENNYQELGELQGEAGAPTSMPEAFNNWFVLSIQKPFSTQVYFYAVHLVLEQGEVSMDDPEQMALFLDDGDGSFDPNLDTLLSEFSNDGPEERKDIICGVNHENCGEHFDIEGGMEVEVELMNRFGLGLFSQTDITYGDSVLMQAFIIPGGRFTTGTSTPIQRTVMFSYKIDKAGPQHLHTIEAKRKQNSITVRWDAIRLGKYIAELVDKDGNVLSTQTNLSNPVVRFSGLKSNTRYQVRVKAIIAGFNSPWSQYLKVRTK